MIWIKEKKDYHSKWYNLLILHFKSTLQQFLGTWIAIESCFTKYISVNKQLQKKNKNVTNLSNIIIPGLGHEHFWTSGTDLAEEGTFFWMATGRPITFTNWNAGEPNNFRYENGEEENCLELWNRDGKGLKWNDTPCSFETYFICEVQ